MVQLMPQNTNTRPIAPSTTPASHPFNLSSIDCSIFLLFLPDNRAGHGPRGLGYAPRARRGYAPRARRPPGIIPAARPCGTRGTLRQEMAEWTGLEPEAPGVTGRYSNQLNYHSACWWVLRGSNPRPSPCKGDALPAELSTPLEEAPKFTRGGADWLVAG